MARQSRTAHHRYTSMLLAVACLLGAVLLTGCWINNEEEDAQARASEALQRKQQMEVSDRIRTGQTKAEEPGAAGDSEVMQYEEAEADPLVGSWSYTEMRVSYPSDQTGKRLGPGTWNPQKAPQKFTILKQAQGYAMKTGAAGTSAVTFDGKRMTLEYSYPTNSARYAGVLSGDTIVGTQHLVLGPDVYDGPWTAMRVK